MWNNPGGPARSTPAMSETAEIHVPRDFRGLPVMDRLAACFDGAELRVFWTVFEFLALNVRPGEVGVVQPGDAGPLGARLDRCGVPRPASGWLEPLQAAELLVPRGGGGWETPLFARHNRHLDPLLGESIQKKGARVRNFNRHVNEAQAPAMQMGLLPEAVFRLADGRLLTAEEIARVRRVVGALDGFTDRTTLRDPQRAADWPGDLVRAAWALAEAPGEQVVCETLERALDLGLVNHPAVPKTTEVLVQEFPALRELLAETEGRVG